MIFQQLCQSFAMTRKLSYKLRTKRLESFATEKKEVNSFSQEIGEG